MFNSYRWHCKLTKEQFFHVIPSIGPRFRVLYLFLALHVTLARPQSPLPTLSPSLTNAVPVCARLCLQSFIAESFPTSICSSQQDLPCLCTHKSTSGYTLGEGAFRCIALTCTNETVRDAGAYQVCAGIQNALPNTHATITATMVAATSAPGDLFDTGAQTTSSQIPLSIVPSSGSISATGLVAATGTPPSQPSPTNASSIVTSTVAPSQTSHAAATTSSTPGTTGALTTPQIAGIAVAGVASASVAFGIMLFLYCLRRRRALKQQMEQLPFEIEKAPQKGNSDPPPPPPKDGETSNDNPGTAVPKVDQAPKVPPKDGAKRRSFWRRTIKPDDIGVAVSPETAHQASPKSIASYRTTSRLLPDKPAYTLWPQPMRILQYTRPESTGTNFEEDLYGGRRSIPNVPLPGFRGSRSVDLGPRLVQRHDLQNQYYSQEYPVDSLALMFAKEKGSHHRRPSLPTNIRPQPQEAPEAQWMAPTNRLERPPALRHPTSLRPGPPQPRNLLQPTSVAPTARSSNYSGNYSVASSEPYLNRPVQSYHPASRRSMSTGLSVRFSNASDTSFESAGEDDETPPLAEPTLSPVVESPQNSPISALKYPKVPRSASIAKTVGVYRPPVETGRDGVRYPSGEMKEHGQPPAPMRRDSSSSSLLAKRRGNKAAAELEKGLKLRQDDNAGPSSKTVLKVINTPGIENARQGLKSPIWEPKLTPTLRGGDLYLEVQ